VALAKQINDKVPTPEQETRIPTPEQLRAMGAAPARGWAKVRAAGRSAQAKLQGMGFGRGAAPAAAEAAVEVAANGDVVVPVDLHSLSVDGLREQEARPPQPEHVGDGRDAWLLPPTAPARHSDPNVDRWHATNHRMELLDDLHLITTGQRHLLLPRPRDPRWVRDFRAAMAPAVCLDPAPRSALGTPLPTPPVLVPSLINNGRREGPYLTTPVRRWNRSYLVRESQRSYLQLVTMEPSACWKDGPAFWDRGPRDLQCAQNRLAFAIMFCGDERAGIAAPCLGDIDVADKVGSLVTASEPRDTARRKLQELGKARFAEWLEAEWQEVHQRLPEASPPAEAFDFLLMHSQAPVEARVGTAPTDRESAKCHRAARQRERCAAKAPLKTQQRNVAWHKYGGKAGRGNSATHRQHRSGKGRQ
jgi:hypothetical protein